MILKIFYLIDLWEDNVSDDNDSDDDDSDDDPTTINIHTQHPTRTMIQSESLATHTKRKVISLLPLRKRFPTKTE